MHAPRYEDPLKTCVSSVRIVLEDTVEDSLATLTSYPSLKEEVLALVIKKVEVCEEDTIKQLILHIKAQKYVCQLAQADRTTLQLSHGIP